MLPTETRYGGFWRRLGALLLDFVILSPITAFAVWGMFQVRLFQLYYLLPGFRSGDTLRWVLATTRCAAAGFRDPVADHGVRGVGHVPGSTVPAVLLAPRIPTQPVLRGLSCPALRGDTGKAAHGPAHRHHRRRARGISSCPAATRAAAGPVPDSGDRYDPRLAPHDRF